MEDAITLHVLSMSGKLLTSLQDVALTETCAQAKQRLGFRPVSVLGPKILAGDGGFMEDDQTFAELAAGSEVNVTLIFSTDWEVAPVGKCTFIRELTALGALSAQVAAAGLNPGMPIDVRECAVRHRSALEREAVRPYAQALAEVLTHDAAHWVRNSAAEALEHTGLAAVYLKALMDAAALDSNRTVCCAVTRIIGALGEESLPVAMDMASVLMEDPTCEVRMAAADALGKIGPDIFPNGALALLEAASTDGDEDVRLQAQQALAAVTSTAATLGRTHGLADFACAVGQSAEVYQGLGPHAVLLARDTLVAASEGTTHGLPEGFKEAVGIALHALGCTSPGRLRDLEQAVSKSGSAVHTKDLTAVVGDWPVKAGLMTPRSGSATPCGRNGVRVLAICTSKGNSKVCSLPSSRIRKIGTSSSRLFVRSLSN